MNAKAEKHLDSAAVLIAVVEATDSTREGYTRIADEIIAAQKADPSLTQGQVGQRLKKGRSWVGDVIQWRQEGWDARPTPFARGDWEHRKQQIAAQTPVEYADRVKMVEKLLEDPKVVRSVLAKPTVAARRVANAVREKDAEERIQLIEQTRRATDARAASAPPMSAAASAMIVKINAWALALDGTHYIADELPSGRPTEVVALALHNLDRAVDDWLRLIEGVSGSHLHVIEGKAG